MDQSSWKTKGRRFFLIVWAATFVALLLVQIFFALFPNYQKERRAERLGAEIQQDLDIVIAAAESYSGLDAYFTLEIEGGRSSSAELLLNGVPIGSFDQGILGFRAAEGDSLEIRGGTKGLIVSMVDPPENLGDTVKTKVVLAGGTKIVSLGQIAFR
ncbi:MAG: hypothetical protein U0M15_01450 [Bacillota bacterium]|nr:hypothetical protein [Bacillota bacterium]